MVEYYFWNGIKVENVWRCPIEDDLQEFLQQFGNRFASVSVLLKTLQAIQKNNSKTSIRHIFQQGGSSLETCLAVLHKEIYFHPYKITLVPELLPQNILTYLRIFHVIFSKTFFIEEILLDIEDSRNFHSAQLQRCRNFRKTTEMKLLVSCYTLT